VLEPSGLEVPTDGYLQRLVDLAHENGALVVFDEVITGFRLAPGGARQRYGVLPDLSCYGKALGNGMPIAAVGGSWSIMRSFEEIFFSGTHGGEVLSLAAAVAVLDTIADGSVLNGIEATGRSMLDGIADRIARHDVSSRVRVSGEPQRSVVSFSGTDHLVVKSWVQQTLIEHGALFNGSMFICARHDAQDVAVALDAFDVAFAALERGADVLDLLKGPAVQPVFRNP
jgi:glutamate-1-semialdehyde 2,1-aminomutase/spore coat polysaccharide biosynthesis protein SpsF